MLQKHGNSHALVIDKPLMEALGVSPQTPLQLTVVGHSLVVAPANVGIGAKAVDGSMRKLRRRYGSMLRNLAK